MNRQIDSFAMRVTHCKPGAYVLLTMIVLAIAYVLYVLFPSNYHADAAYAVHHGVRRVHDDPKDITMDNVINQEQTKPNTEFVEELPDNDPGPFGSTTESNEPSIKNEDRPAQKPDFSGTEFQNTQPFVDEFVKTISPGSSKPSSGRYEPSWESLDQRPLPAWYDDVKFGIFVHWGIFSVPAFRSEWFWYRWKRQEHPAYVEHMQKNYRPGFKYTDFATEFKAEYFDPAKWANLFEAAGAKYVVFTSKHHEGFTMWPSKYSYGWNSMDTGPGRDIVGELAKAIRKKQGMRFGLYHSLYEWFNPLYLADRANNFTTQSFVTGKTLPGLFELVTQYQPDVLWSDGAWEGGVEYWNSTSFLAWLYNESPVKDTVVVNDRWGKATRCYHGDIHTCKDRYNPGELQPHKWENCMTIDRQSWGYRKNAALHEYLSIEKLITTLVETVSCGGNLLMNVGPTAEGRIAPIYEERLRQVGSWLRVNGDAIYRTKPWTHQEDTVTKGVWYTTKKYFNIPTVYAIMLHWPESNTLVLGAPKPKSDTTVTMLGVKRSIQWSKVGEHLEITLPPLNPSEIPCQWAWVLKFEHL